MSTPEELLIRARVLDEVTRPVQQMRRDIRGLRQDVRDLSATTGQSTASAATHRRALKDTHDEVRRGTTAHQAHSRSLRELGQGVDFAGSKLRQILLPSLRTIRSVIGGGGLGGALGIIGLGAETLRLGLSAESAGKRFDNVFGPAAARMSNRLEGINHRLGLTLAELKAAEAGFGQLGVKIGVPAEKLPVFAENLVRAGLDLAAYWDVDPAKVLADIQNGLEGSGRALLDYGIDLDETHVKAAALTYGIIVQGQELSDAQAIIVRQRLITEGLGLAMGAANSNVLTGNQRWRELIGRAKEFLTTVGLSLIPMLDRLAANLERYVTGAQERLNTVMHDGAWASRDLADKISYVITGGTDLGVTLRDLFKIGRDVYSVFVDVARIAKDILPVLQPLLSLLERILSTAERVANSPLIKYNPFVNPVAPINIYRSALGPEPGRVGPPTTQVGPVVLPLPGQASSPLSPISANRSPLERLADWLNPFGDAPTPHGRAGANYARTLAAYSRLQLGIPGRRTITSGIRTFGLGSPGSDHLAGGALDVVGPGLPTVMHRVRAAGGFAEPHGDHAHLVPAPGSFGDTPSPRGWSMSAGGAGMNVSFGDIYVDATGATDPEAVGRAVKAAVRGAFDEYVEEIRQRGGKVTIG